MAHDEIIKKTDNQHMSSHSSPPKSLFDDKQRRQTHPFPWSTKLYSLLICIPGGRTNSVTTSQIVKRRHTYSRFLRAHSRFSRSIFPVFRSDRLIHVCAARWVLVVGHGRVNLAWLVQSPWSHLPLYLCNLRYLAHSMDQLNLTSFLVRLVMGKVKLTPFGINLHEIEHLLHF